MSIKQADTLLELTYSANIGDTDGALTIYRKALRIRESFGPSALTTDTQMELGRTYRALGDIMELKGDVGQTIRNYRHSLRIFAQLAQNEPANPTIQNELARAYETLADGLDRTANSDAELLSDYRKSLAICQELLRHDGSNAKRKRAVAINLMKIGGVLDPHQPEAIASLRRGVLVLESLAASDPTNGRARREVGWGYKQLGTTQGGCGGLSWRRRESPEIARDKESSAAADPQNAQASLDLASGHVDLAEALTASGDPSHAIEQANQGIAILNGLLSADPTNASYSLNLGIYYERLGDAFARAGTKKDALVADRLHSWSAAQKSYQKANQIFAGLKARGALPPADAADQPVKFAKRMKDCREAIKALEATTGSPLTPSQ